MGILYSRGFPAFMKSSGFVTQYCLSLTFLSVCLWGQANPDNNRSASAANATAKRESSEAKRTPQQERGLRLLKAAEVEAGGLEPDMRAFVLWRVANAYERSDPKKAAKLLEAAFAATQSIEDPPEGEWCSAPGSAGDIKGWVQQQVLIYMLHKDKVEEVEQLLPQAITPIRDQITAELVRYYKSKKDLIRAQAVLTQLADSGMYPFTAAAELIEAMGPEQSADRTTVFTQAIENYVQHPKGGGEGPGGIATLLDRTWKEVPSALVLESINKILEAAKEDDSPQHYSVAAAKGSVILNSTYDLHLFELFPILEQIDKDKAQALLNERVEVAQQLKAFPNGLKSLSSDDRDISYGFLGGSPVGDASAKQQVQAQTQERLNDVQMKVATDPEGALAVARTLPINGVYEISAPRAEALLEIAERTLKTKPSIAKAALDEFAAIEDQLTLQQIGVVARLPELYLGLGDVEGAKKAVKFMVKAASKLYDHDTDADDPNKGFKGAWPSTDMWRLAIKGAAKISPMFPEEIIADLQDPEIAAYEKVEYGGALLGESGMNSPIIVSDCRKNGGNFRVSF